MKFSLPVFLVGWIVTFEFCNNKLTPSLGHVKHVVFSSEGPADS